MIKDFFYKKRILSFILTFTLLIGGVFCITLYASQNTDIVKKNVLMNEENKQESDITGNVGDRSSEITIPGEISNEKANEIGAISKEEAVKIAKNALKKLYGEDVSAREASSELQLSAKLFEDVCDGAHLCCWMLKWTTPEQIKQMEKIGYWSVHFIDTVFVEAKTGKLFIVNVSSPILQNEVIRTNEQIVNIAKDFIKSRNLDEGTKIVKAKVLGDAERSMLVSITYDNKTEHDVSVSKYEDKVYGWQNYSLWDLYKK